MNRTSVSHPLQIAALEVPGKPGRVGVTFCPGKVQSDAATGSWERDLGVDLDAIAAWGAAVVVSLVEPHELDELRVPNLGYEVCRRHMQWLHLPIADYSPPGPDFERAWKAEGRRLQDLLGAGFDILVHCKGGLGRAGTVAARILVEAAMTADDAIRQVRLRRPGAIETEEQERHIRKLNLADGAGDRFDRSKVAKRDRAIGALVGLAVGDAVGTTNEFKSRDDFPIVTDIVGGGPFALKPGQWTDDTSMALALADSLSQAPELDVNDLMTRFVSWWKEGAYSCTGTCFDIGVTTRQALQRFLSTGIPLAGSQDADKAGNGSLMRLSPVAIRHGGDREKRRRAAALQSRSTHAAPQAVDACILFADMIADAIAGDPLTSVLSPRDLLLSPAIASINNGSWRGKPERDIRTSGYVAHTLEAAIWAVARTTSFEDAILLAANLGDDADTTAAVAGQLAGAVYGLSGIPARWRKLLAWGRRLENVAGALHLASVGEI
jgi:ADP-ribosyl-[dinitrogen reductase] hydrolase